MFLFSPYLLLLKPKIHRQPLLSDPQQSDPLPKQIDIEQVPAERIVDSFYFIRM